MDADSMEFVYTIETYEFHPVFHAEFNLNMFCISEAISITFACWNAKYYIQEAKESPIFWTVFVCF